MSSKIDMTPRRHHAYSVFLFILGTLFPPLAVAARFGIGRDFWLNLLLTICGYIPGHGHNFYIQNIRNNKNHRRTPKWAQRYGLVDTSKIERNKKRSQWAGKYNDRLPHSTFEGQEYAEGEVGSVNDYDNGGSGNANSRPESILGPEERERSRKNKDNSLWSQSDERYYGQSSGSLDSASRSTGDAGGGRWHYPANFEDTLEADDILSGGKKKKKSGKKDRWARTEDAYSIPEERPKKRKSKVKRSKGRSTVGGAENDGPSVGNGNAEYDRRSSLTSVDDIGFPEDPEGGLYGQRRGIEVPDVPAIASGGQQRDELEHEF